MSPLKSLLDTLDRSRRIVVSGTETQPGVRKESPMTAPGLLSIDRNIARCRLILSIAAIAAMYIDPAEPLLSRWIPLVSGPFVMDPRLTAVLAAHLTYSLLMYFGLRRRW